jgi:hypothetical protein
LIKHTRRNLNGDKCPLSRDIVREAVERAEETKG